MANHRRTHNLPNENKDTGFGSGANSFGGRFLNKDGTMNMRREGISIFKKFSAFQAMLTIPIWKFIGIILTFYFAISLLFAGVYLTLGIGGLQGLDGSTLWERFKEVFYFSAQTLTTVSYGRVIPIGDGVNIIASVEALTGLMSLAVATGLIYGRFARPQSYLVFSHNALISPYQDKTGLMFRIVSYKEKHSLTDVEIIINMGMLVTEDGKQDYRFYKLELERDKIDSLVMNWTIVHPIDEKSPIYGFTAEDMKSADVELYIFVRGFDDVFSTTVQQRTSYTYPEILFHKKFAPMYRESEDGKTSILQMHKLNDYVDVKNN
ncbi:MAG: ion channel [Bacteroidia bacterium]